jgi:hypothetical protein
MMLKFTAIFVLCLGLACGTETGETNEYLSATQALIGRDLNETLTAGIKVTRGVEVGANVGFNCPVSTLDEAHFNEFAQVVLPDIVAKARVIAHSAAFQNCVKQTITVGAALVSGRAQGFVPAPVIYGPYVPTPEDRGYYSTSNMPISRARGLMAQRLMSEVLSPHSLVVNCSTAGGGGAIGSGLNREAPEEMRIAKGYFDAAFEGSTPGFGNYRANLARLIWHESMHVRGYNHPSTVLDTVPYIVGACMEEAFAQSESACGLAPCPGGKSVVATLNSTACTCVGDPTPAATNAFGYTGNSWYTPQFSQIAVDGAGNAYVREGNVISLLASGGTKAIVGEGTIMAAGGDALVFGSPSPYYPLTCWNMRSPEGSNTCFKWTVGGGNVIAVDSYGAAYFGSELGASKLYAGSDLLFKTDSSTGHQYRYDRGSQTWTWVAGPAAEVAVDSCGLMYHLSPDRSVIYRNPTQWTWTGSASAKIVAADALYSTPNLGGSVHRKEISGHWQQIGLCDDFAAGGRVFYCFSATYGHRVYQLR